MTLNEFIGVLLSAGSGFVLGFILAADHYAKFYQDELRRLNHAR